MRLKLSLITGLIALLFSPLNAQAKGLEKVPLEIATIKQVSGEVVLEIEGYLPDSCYSPARAETRNGKGVVMVDVVSKVEGEMCAEVVSFYKLSVPLGPFPIGRHSVVLQEGSRWEREVFFQIGSREIQEL